MVSSKINAILFPKEAIYFRSACSSRNQMKNNLPLFSLKLYNWKLREYKGDIMFLDVASDGCFNVSKCTRSVQTCRCKMEPQRSWIGKFLHSNLLWDSRPKDGMRPRLQVSISLGEQEENVPDTLRCGTISEECPERQQQKCIWTRFCKVVVQRRGIFWALAFSILCSFVSLTIKLLSGRVSPNQIMLYRSFTVILFTAPSLVSQRHRVSYCWKAWGLLIIRGIVGTATGICAYYGLQQLDISTVKCIMQSSTLITCIFACLCLKETCSLPITLSCCISVVGVLLVVQPAAIFGGSSSYANGSLGLFATLSAAVMLSVTYITLRVLGRFKDKVHAQFITFSFGCIGFLGSAALLSALNEWSIPRCGPDRLLVLAICTMGYLQIMTITLALQTENAAIVAVISTTGVFVTFVLDYAFFGVTPNILKAVGALCVTASSVCATVSSYYAARRKLSADEDEK